jgi:hypothetical protein
VKKQQEPDWRYPGAIISDAMYSVGELIGRMNWDAEDLLRAMGDGLKIHMFGNHVYVFGSEVMRFIKESKCEEDFGE